MSRGDEFSNMPISQVVYGKDHPSRRPPVAGKEPVYPGTRIAGLLNERTMKKIARKFPRTRKYLPKKPSVQEVEGNVISEVGGRYP